MFKKEKRVPVHGIRQIHVTEANGLVHKVMRGKEGTFTVHYFAGSGNRCERCGRIDHSAAACSREPEIWHESVIQDFLDSLSRQGRIQTVNSHGVVFADAAPRMVQPTMLTRGRTMPCSL